MLGLGGGGFWGLWDALNLKGVRHLVALSGSGGLAWRLGIESMNPGLGSSLGL